MNLFKMEIIARKTSGNAIDVRDSSGIRILLLTEKENKGLYAYFEIRIAQAETEKAAVCKCCGGELEHFQTVKHYHCHKCNEVLQNLRT